MRLLFLSLLGLILHFSLTGQILDVSPIFPQQNSTVTIIYDATEGNGALVGLSPVYGHIGVITDQSTSPTDWKYVQGSWGTPDPDVLMTDLGNNKHSITYNISSFHGVPGGETVEKMAFVFRNADGTTVGRASDGSDIYYDVYSANSGLLTAILSPNSNSLIYEIGDNIAIAAAASLNATLTIYDNGNQLFQTTGTDLNYSLPVTTGGNHTVTFEAMTATETSTQTFNYTVNPSQNIQDPPAGTKMGINYIDATTVVLSLYAPNKDYVYLLSDLNSWIPDAAYFMNKSTDGNTYWIELENLTAGQEYAYQYLVDGEILIADPYSEVVLDPNNDDWIPSITYPNLMDYPVETSGIVTLLQPGKPAYNWQVTNFQKPEKTELVIYELLLRDFIDRHDYETLIDSLNYLENLGVNAIELMPVNEFEGNISWGYNPSFHMALDKYYGDIETFKMFIDECHSRGIAVILDAVFNHAFSQSPLCQLYWDSPNFKPSSDNPWLNTDATHDYNVGYDFNHDSEDTRDFMDRVNSYWVEEFKIDGFRFDLTKGFTQNIGGSFDAWAYDASRIFNLKRMADVIWDIDDETYVILEHFAQNSEEIELADYGCLLWGGYDGHHNYLEASMGYSSNFSTVSYLNRGWTVPHIVNYMESHDEERMMYKNLQYGASGANGYNIKNLPTALDRVGLCAAFFFTVPGPKMLWQFGEVGYDYPIEYNGRTGPKPIEWGYFQDGDRRGVYNMFSSLIKLKRENEVFHTTDFTLNTGQSDKRKWIHFNHSSMDAIVVGNFDVNGKNIAPNFQNMGTWYEFTTGESINVTDVNEEFYFLPGEFRIYSTQPLTGEWVNTNQIVSQEINFDIFPNPSGGGGSISYEVSNFGTVSIELYNVLGQSTMLIFEGEQEEGFYQLEWENENLSQGTYFMKIKQGNKTATKRLLIAK